MINCYRRSFLRIVGTVVCAALGIANSLAQQNYPTKPIRMILGFAAGSQADVTARNITPRLSQILGQQILFENRVGASGAIGAEFVARSPADGYTLLLATTADSILPALRADLPYDLVRDFAPVSLLAIGPQVLVVKAALPVQSVKELIALAQAQPGKLTYGSTGVGTLTHLAGELLKSKAKINILHVPYKGGADSAVATAAGEVDMTFPAIPSALPLMNAGKLRALAISGPKRMAIMPAVPTWEELGMSGWDRMAWYGVLAPAATPKDIIARLNGAIVKVLAAPELKEGLNKDGREPQATTPEQFAAYISRELSENRELMKATGAKGD